MYSRLNVKEKNEKEGYICSRLSALETYAVPCITNWMGEARAVGREGIVCNQVPYSLCGCTKNWFWYLTAFAPDSCWL